MRCLIQNTHLGEAHAHAGLRGGAGGTGGRPAPTFPPPARVGTGRDVLGRRGLCCLPSTTSGGEKPVHFRVEIFQMLHGTRGSEGGEAAQPKFAGETACQIHTHLGGVRGWHTLGTRSPPCRWLLCFPTPSHLRAPCGT